MSPILSDLYRWSVSLSIKLWLLFRRTVRYHFSTVVLPGNLFEGENLIGRNSVVARSYLGKYSYVGSDSRIVATKIGRFCSIGDNVRTCLGRHKVDGVSTHPLFFSRTPPTGRPMGEAQDFPEHIFLESGYVVEIGSDVWIGSNVLISDGVRIGNGAVIGMGSVVTSDVSDFDIVAGVPARTMRNRFSEDIKSKLINSRWWDSNLEDLDIEELVSLLKG